jgi:glutamyl-tRNA reductase
LYDLDSLQSKAKRTLAVRQPESEKCLRLIERHVLDFPLWIERTHSLNFPSIVAQRFDHRGGFCAERIPLMC